MAKIVSLSEDAYDELAGLKRPGESFSIVVRRLTREKRKSILEFAGKWAGPPGEAKRIFGEILAERHRSRTREVSL